MLLSLHAARRGAAKRLTLPVLTVCGLLAVAPAGAAAATRYASPDATATSGACPQTAPCTLAAAVSGSVSGDEVVVAPGTYTLASALKAKVPVNLHGAAGEPAPKLVAGSGVNGPYAVGLLAGGSIADLSIATSSTHQAALKLKGGVGDDLLLSAAGTGDSGDGPHAAVTVVSTKAPAAPTVLRDTVAWGSGPKMAAVSVRKPSSDDSDNSDNSDGASRSDGRATSSQDGQGDGSGASASGSDVASGAPVGAVLVNVTAVATGDGSKGIKTVDGTGSVTLIDVIARGVAADLQGPAGSFAASYSDFRPGVSAGFVDGGHNITADPTFVGAATGDFHEVAGSPTIDAGTTAPQSGTVDPDGAARQIGSAPDVGAYEFNPAGAALTGGLGQVMPGTGLLPPPVANQTINVVPAQGEVLVRAPGAPAFVPLTAGQQVPVGSDLDTSNGVVMLTSVKSASGTLQSGRFWGGQFRVDQHGGTQPVTQLSLTGSLAGCNQPAAAAQGTGTVGIAAAVRRARPRARMVWGSDNHGHFSTRGNNALATVRGTVWMMKDTCRGTMTKVLKGKVSVRDLRTGRSFLVRAGHHRLVRTGH